MTEAMFTTFIKSQLRGATWKWFPVSECLKAARHIKGWYLCNGCKNVVPATKKNAAGKRMKNVFVDHIKPIVNPITGFTTWDEFVNNLFCEKDNLQLLCGDCHTAKTNEEKKLAVEARKERATIGKI